MVAAAVLKPGTGASNSRNLNTNLLGETLARGVPRLLEGGGGAGQREWRGAAGGKQERGNPANTKGNADRQIRFNSSLSPNCIH